MPYWLHEPQPCLLAESSGCNAGLQTAQAGVKAAWVFAEVVQVNFLFYFCFRFCSYGIIFLFTLLFMLLSTLSLSLYVVFML